MKQRPRGTDDTTPTLAPLAAPKGGAVSPLGRPCGTDDTTPTLAPLAAPKGGAVSPLGRPCGTDDTTPTLAPLAAPKGGAVSPLGRPCGTDVRVQVAFAGVAEQALVTLDLPHGASVADAVAQSGLGLADDVNGGLLACAVFGRRVDHDTPLREGDRVEITRPLVCDAKTARQRRAARRR